MKKLIIIGSGGLGREVAQYIKDINKINQKYEILGFIDDDISKKGLIYNNIEVIGTMELSKKFSVYNDVYVFCAIANPCVKIQKSKQILKYNIKTINIIHPTSYLSESVVIGQNVLISPMCVLTTNITIGNYVTINPQCGIGHDTIIEDFATLYWNVNTSGFSKIKNSAELGTKTFIKQNISIGKEAVTGAGAVIIKDVPEKTVVKGVPAV